MAFDAWIIYVGLSVSLSAAVLIERLFAKDEQLAFLRKCLRVPIASAPDGQMARLSGRLVLAEECLVAPLSGRPCAYYEVTVEEYEPGGGDVAAGTGDWGGWATRHFEWAGREFFIEDETGRALIRQTKPNVLLDIDKTAKPRRFGKPPAELDAYLTQLMARPDAPIIRDPQRVRVREGVLEEGELINVHGLCRWGSAVDATGYREAARLLIVTGAEGQMLVTDKSV